MRVLVLWILLLASVVAGAGPFVVASKPFTESYVLGEIALRALKDAGIEAEHRKGIGATGIVWEALKKGDVTAYPEYTGTISEEILKQPGLGREAMEAALKKYGVGMLPDLGFNDGYGLVMTRAKAEKLEIRTISDLAGHPELTAGITNELLGRADGFKPLTRKYGLRFASVKGIEHALGYAALASGATDVKDCYTTDAQIARLKLLVLEDDRRFFPLYRAVFLHRLDAPPAALAALRKLSGTIDDASMTALNERADTTKDYAAAARLYFKDTRAAPVEARFAWLWPLLSRHLALVFGALALSILVGVPLGILASRGGWLGGLLLGVTGVVQTIPSLALLALLVPIPFFGISPKTAVAALFLYGLLPIVRNTAVGLQSVAPGLRESARALGLEPSARLRKVYLPLAFPTIMAGIKTSAVTNVGTATLAALIGAGGLGEPIVSGLSLNDTDTILRGAVPAAGLAVVVQLLFDGFERFVTRARR